MPNTEEPGPGQGPSRRCVVRCAAVSSVSLPLLAACGGGDGSSRSGNRSGGSSPATVAAADVPVGGGLVLTRAQVVVTQPEKGSFKAFSAVCTHMGCLVDAVRDRQIVCPCHGSHYSITDGSVVSGPAPSALPPRTVHLKGGQLSVG